MSASTAAWISNGSSLSLPSPSCNKDQFFFCEQFEPYGNMWKILSGHSGNTHLLYHLSESGADELIRLHPEREFHLTLEGGAYGLPLLAALYAKQTKAARALLGLPSTSIDTQTEQSSGSNSILKKDRYRKTHNVLAYLCGYGDAELLRQTLSTRKISELRDHMILFYRYAASEAIVDVLAEMLYSSPFRRLPLPGQEIPIYLPQTDGSSNINGSIQHLKNALLKDPHTMRDTDAWHTGNLFSYAASKGFPGITKLCIGHVYACSREEAFVAAVDGQVNSKGRTAVVEQLLGTGLELDRTNETLKHALFNMILKPHNEDLVKLLLTRVGWYLEVKNSDGLTPLLWALHQGRKTYFRIFLDAGANPMARSPRHRKPTALMLAIEKSDLSSFRQLLKHPRYRLDAHDEGASTASYWRLPTSYNGPTFTMLLEILKQPGMIDHLGRSLLSKAVELPHEGVVNAFLTIIGISPDCASDRDPTPLWKSLTAYVVTKLDTYLRIARMLLRHGADFYCSRRPTTPAYIIAQYDLSIHAELKEIWLTKAGGKTLVQEQIPTSNGKG